MRPTTAVLLCLLAACAHKPDPQAGAGQAAADGSAGGAPAVPPAAAPGPTDVNTGDASVQDTGRLARLEARARAIAPSGGCTQAAQCRAAPVGNRPCGGPRTYVAYCAATTDSASLYARLDELKRAETAYNQAAGIMSTCEYREPPAVTLRGGRCVAQAGDGRTEVPR
jgi:hypothetical protein